MPLAPEVTSREQLLEGLARERVRAELTTGELAELAQRAAEERALKVRWSQSKVSRLQGGKRRVRRSDVVTWLDATRAEPATRERLLDLADEVIAEQHGWASVWGEAGGPAGRQADYLAWEADAEGLIVCQPMVVPGLLQTAEYARRIVTGFGVPAAEVPAMVRARIERAGVIYDPGKRVQFLIYEEALRRRVVPADVLVAQLDHIATIATLANVDLGIIRLDSPVRAAPITAFQVFELPGEETIVTVELPHDEVVVDDPDDVARYRAVAADASRAAVHGQDAVGFVNRVRADVAWVKGPRGGESQ